MLDCLDTDTDIDTWLTVQPNVTAVGINLHLPVDQLRVISRFCRAQ